LIVVLLNVPHPGEQDVPPCVRLQVTPGLELLATLAVNCAEPFTWMLDGCAAMLTVIAGGGAEDPPPPHPEMAPKTRREMSRSFLMQSSPSEEVHCRAFEGFSAAL